MDCTRVVDHLYVGSCPRTNEDIAMLHKAGIGAVLSLQTDEDHAYVSIDWPKLEACYRSLGIEVCRVPVRDFDPEDLATRLPRCVCTLRDLLDRGRTVYVHCTAGTGRSPTVAIAYLHWQCGMSLEKAYRHVRARRACSPTLGPSTMPQRPKEIDQNSQDSRVQKKT